MRIIRDDFGVPHIYSDDLGALFFGYGYAVAEDRLFQIEVMRRSVWGTVAEVLGPEYLEFDRRTRQMGYTRTEIRRRINALPASYQKMLTAYADGVNHFVSAASVGAHPKLSAEFAEFRFQPARWTPEDVAQIFIGTMAVRHSDGSREVEDAALLDALIRKFGKEKAQIIFDDVIPRVEDPNPVVTIPASADRSRRGDLGGLCGTVPEGIGAVSTTIGAAQSAYASGLERLSLASTLGSSCWVISAKRTGNGSAILMGGPQMGFTIPAYVHEIGLHGAGFDLVGATPAGYLPVLFGHNAKIAWSSTAGGSDMVDVFVEKLDPKNPTRYYYQGAWRNMQTREEIFRVKGSADVKATFYRTVHGPVMTIDAAHHYAYARRRGWEGLELESMAGWIDKTRSSTFDEFLRASHRMALTINWFYADRNGKIGYVHNGHYPIRNPAQDLRLPASGTGEREWRGFLPATQNPHVYNPAQGFIANWNNQPERGWFFAGGHFYHVERARILIDYLQPKSVVTLDEARDLNRYASFADTTLPFFRDALLAAVKKSGHEEPDVERAAQLLSAWNGLREDRDGDGKYDSPGLPIFRAWLRTILADAFSEEKVGPASAMLQYTPGDTPLGARILFRVLAGAAHGDYLSGAGTEGAMAASFRKAVAELRRESGRGPDTWRDPVEYMVFRNRNFQQVPQSHDKEPRLRAMNRGTENHLVVLSKAGIQAMNVMPPGESGHSTNAHATDQLRLFANFDYKPMNFELGAIRQAAESQEELVYPQ